MVAIIVLSLSDIVYVTMIVSQAVVQHSHKAVYWEPHEAINVFRAFKSFPII